ncbi:MAG: hypothetical protein IJX92_04265 [Clostridia bacterium]|nr:hypothetical protein [Clostridia bacterium]
MRNFLAGLLLFLGVFFFIVFGVDIFTRQIAEPLFSIIFILAQVCIGAFAVLNGQSHLAVTMGVLLLVEFVILLFFPTLWFVAYF